MKYSRIKNNLGHLCRHCLNRVYSIHLKPSDCGYTMYLAQCERCGKVKNIVKEISFQKRMEIRFMPTPKEKHTR